RRQPGTPSLRAVLYMDEVFGFMPPVANPPTKRLLLTLLKQARAYGIGVVLSTQNPVDLDYKGLANAGTWFIGRMQTERDKARVIEGLRSAAGGERLTPADLDATISSLGKRRFLLHNVHESAPVVFETRWVMSYLAGPLTREQIKALVPNEQHARGAEAARSAGGADKGSALPRPVHAGPSLAAARPVLPPGVPERFFPCDSASSDGLVYMPKLFAAAELSYGSARLGFDERRSPVLCIDVDGDAVDVDWEGAQVLSLSLTDLDPNPVDGARFGPVPPLL